LRCFRYRGSAGTPQSVFVVKSGGGGGTGPNPVRLRAVRGRGTGGGNGGQSRGGVLGGPVGNQNQVRDAPIRMVPPTKQDTTRGPDPTGPRARIPGEARGRGGRGASNLFGPPSSRLGPYPHTHSPTSLPPLSTPPCPPTSSPSLATPFPLPPFQNAHFTRAVGAVWWVGGGGDRAGDCSRGGTLNGRNGAPRRTGGTWGEQGQDREGGAQRGGIYAGVFATTPHGLPGPMWGGASRQNFPRGAGAPGRRGPADLPVFGLGGGGKGHSPPPSPSLPPPSSFFPPLLLPPAPF